MSQISNLKSQTDETPELTRLDEVLPGLVAAEAQIDLQAQNHRLQPIHIELLNLTWQTRRLIENMQWAALKQQEAQVPS